MTTTDSESPGSGAHKVSGVSGVSGTLDGSGDRDRDRDRTAYELNDRYLIDDGEVFLTGIQALARLPLEQLRADRRAGSRTAAFISGYQGSPLGGFGEEARRAAELAPDLPIVVKPAMNEEYGATAVMGSQLAVAQPDCRYDGIVGIWYGKAPGVDRAADALRHAVYSGTSMRGGAVALVGDDPGAKSSTIPSSSAGLLFDMHIPIMYPGDPAEALKFGRHAIAMSRSTGLWVAMKIVADVADATATVNLHADAFRPILPLMDGRPYQHGPDGRLLTPHTLDLEQEIVEVRYELARRYATENALNYRTADPGDAWIGIVSSGITYREVMEAFARLGLRGEAAIAECGIRLLKMGMPMPFNAALMAEFGRGVEEILVIEEKAPNIESLIKDALYDLAERPLVVGKHDEHGVRLCAAHGALDADAIVPILRRRLSDRLGDKLVADRPERRKIRLALEPLSVQRSPFFCSGCPHNRSTEVPAGSLVGAGIGCHTMTLLMDPERVGDIAAITCMGNEGTQWIGMSPFIERDHFIQNLGDGTFFHSGLLAISAAVAANVNITYKLLFNGTVAMTGGQDAVGGRDAIDTTKLLLALGVRRVLITTDDTDRYRSHTRPGGMPDGVDVWSRTRLIEAQEELAKVQGVTVLLHDQACAAESRRDRKRGLLPTPQHRVVINHRICEGCGDCGRISNCLSVQPTDTFFGPKTQIDQTTCNFDYSCLEGDCPSFMTVRVAEPTNARNPLARLGVRLRQGPGRRAAARLAASLPDVTHPAKGAAPLAVAHPSPPDNLPEPVLVVPQDDFAMRITGIGGTGVVTVAQVLGTAAMLAGYHVRGLDQIGLSQKAGPVVSDVRLSRSAPTATNRLGEGQADLLLALDQLVAASDKGLLTADPQKTTVVGSISPTPTGEMITHLDVHMPSVDTLSQRIAAFTRDGHRHWADAQSLTEDLFGSAATANVLVLGMAVQSGCLPVDPGHVEAAIELNAVAVDANRAAFRWGRAVIARPDVVSEARRVRTGATAQRLVHPPNSVGSGSDLPAALVARLDALGAPDAVRGALDAYARELVAWQDHRRAGEWIEVVERVSHAEHGLGSDPATVGLPLTAAVAANLFKLMAYKDEYEVARLMTDPGGLAALGELDAEPVAVAWRLHPPMLRSMGLQHKITIGAWATPAIRALARAKVVRGTPLDPFRWAEVRRVERALPKEYVGAIDRVLAGLSIVNLPAAIELAGLADLVRGYEQIKLANVERFRQALRRGLASFA